MPAPNTRALNHIEMSDMAELDRARTGMWKEQQFHIPLQQYIYRFASQSQPTAQGYSGAWWFRFEDYRKIEAFAERSGLTLGYAARRYAALAYEWPGCNVDLVERALVTDRLDAWAGPGRVIYGTLRAKGQKTSHYTLVPPKDVMQLYIPGLRTGSGPTAVRSSISHHALKNCTQTPIASGYFS